MENNKSSITSLVSAFTRAYHAQQDSPLIFNDTFAKKLIVDEEYKAIAQSMLGSASFFSPSIAKQLAHDPQALLQWIVHTQLSPTPLARAAYAEKIVLHEIMLGATQYVILGAGLDTFSWRYPTTNAHIFEVDHPTTQQFKRQRLQEVDIDIPSRVTFVGADLTATNLVEMLKESGFDPMQKTVISLLGVTYYLTDETLNQLLSALFEKLPQGSSIIFDVADETLMTTHGIYHRVENMVQMAAGAGEPMTFSTSIPHLAQLLENNQLLMYEHLMPDDIQQQYFAHRADDLQAFETIHYIHAVKH